MIILTMQLQRIVAKMLGNLKRINLLLSCLWKKKFCHDNGHRHAKICKYRLGRLDNKLSHNSFQILQNSQGGYR